MSHYIREQIEYDNWLANAKLIPAILRNPDNYSTHFIESIINGYEIYELSIYDDPPSNYLKLIDIINNREK